MLYYYNVQNYIFFSTIYILRDKNYSLPQPLPNRQGSVGGYYLIPVGGIKRLFVDYSSLGTAHAENGKISFASLGNHAKKCRIVHKPLQPLAMAYATACYSQCKRLHFF